MFDIPSTATSRSNLALWQNFENSLASSLLQSKVFPVQMGQIKRKREEEERKKYELRCEARTRQRLASLPRSTHHGAYIRARAAYARPLPRSCAHKRPGSTQTLRVHELLAARALTQSKPGGCTHTRSPLSVHARIRLLIGACRGRLGSTNFDAPLRAPLYSRECIQTGRYPNSRTSFTVFQNRENIGILVLYWWNCLLYWNFVGKVIRSNLSVKSKCRVPNLLSANIAMT